MAFFSRPQSASAAVKIVRPDTHDEPIRPQSRKDSVQRQCRNIMIYGSCKFQDKGCIYYHPPAPDAPSQAAQLPYPLPRTESPAPPMSLPAEAVNAPVFVPKSISSAPAPAATPPPPSVTSSSPPSSEPQYEYQDQEQHQHQHPHPHPHETYDSYDDQMQSLDPKFYDHQSHDQGLYQQHHYDPNSTMEMDMDMDMGAFYSASQAPTFVRQPLNYHLYTTPIPPSFVASPNDTHFIPSSSALRELLQARSETIRSAPAPGLNLPEELQGYHSLVPLEGGSTERRKFGTWYSTVYRAINSTDGSAYALRRIEEYRLMHQAAFVAIEAWSKIRHPGIVSVREAFTTRSFGDSSLVVAYAYHPNAQTLYDAHIKPKPHPPPPASYKSQVPPAYQSQVTYQHGRVQAPENAPIAERTIWSYVVQIACAIKKVHDAGRAVRVIDVTKVLLTDKNRVRISSCGIVDVLLYEAHHDINTNTLLLQHQQEDLNMFGRLILVLCCLSTVAATGANLPKSLQFMDRVYSPDLKNVVLFLISKGGAHKGISQLFDMIGSRLVTEMDDSQSAMDTLQAELMSGLENARIVRLMCKLGFINERPEFARDARWSETGDRYIVKLFRDYVFHQVDEAGNPVVNLSHVLTCLNKLDAGTDERMMLVARDEQSCLVVSYKEVKSCIEAAFSDLARSSMSVGGYR